MLILIKKVMDDKGLTFTVKCSDCGCETTINAGITTPDYAQYYADHNTCTKCKELFNPVDCEDTKMFKEYVIFMIDQAFTTGIISAEETCVIEFYAKRNMNMLINMRSLLKDKAGRMREVIYSYCMGPVNKCTKKKMYGLAFKVVKDLVKFVNWRDK